MLGLSATRTGGAGPAPVSSKVFGGRERAKWGEGKGGSTKTTPLPIENKEAIQDFTVACIGQHLAHIAVCLCLPKRKGSKKDRS